MVIFLLTAVPVFYLIITDTLSDIRKRAIEDNFRPLTYGVICFLGAAVIYNIIRLIFMTPEYTVKNLYVYYLLHDSLLQYIMAFAGYILVFGIDNSLNEERSLDRILAFFCGYYCLWAVNDVVINYGWYNSHNLLIVPLQRLGLISGFSFFFIEGIYRKGVLRWLFFVICLILPFITTAGSLLWRLSMMTPVILITAGLPVLSLALIYLKIKKAKVIMPGTA